MALFLTSLAGSLVLALLGRILDIRITGNYWKQILFVFAILLLGFVLGNMTNL